MAILGGCHCGHVRYALAMDSLPAVYACHCLDCQSSSGSAFSEHAMLPDALVAVTGSLDISAHAGTGGNGFAQHVCRSCRIRIYETLTALPGMVVLEAGTLDDSHRIEPIAHIWVKRKQPWLVLPADVPTWAETPSPEEFMAVTRKDR